MAMRKLIAFFRVGHKKYKAGSESVLEHSRKYRYSIVSKTSKTGHTWNFEILKTPGVNLKSNLLVSLCKDLFFVVLAHPIWETLRRSLGA
jgi:hypothetical protein